MFETTICTGENTWDPSRSPQGMNLLQPETTCCSQISIYNHYLLSLKNPQIKSRAAEICNVATGKTKWLRIPCGEKDTGNSPAGSLGCPRAEMHLVVLIPRELGHPAPKGEGNAWSGSHQPQFWLSFSFSSRENNLIFMISLERCRVEVGSEWAEQEPASGERSSGSSKAQKLPIKQPYKVNCLGMTPPFNDGILVAAPTPPAAPSPIACGWIF